MALLGLSVQTSGLIAGILAVIFGILIIKYPKIIPNLIGTYLIITGLLTVLAVL
jgi:hypothetical protein